MADFGISQGSPTFFLAGEIDLATAPIIEAAIGDAVASGGPITLDVSQVSFLDSSGIGIIVAALKHLPSGCIVLHGVVPHVQRALDLTGVTEIPNLHTIPCSNGHVHHPMPA
jgi:anti-sigma B factor antagonist